MDIFKIIEKTVYGFFMFFFVLYIGRFGLDGLILEPINKWNILFNIGVWFVLTMFCMNGFFKDLFASKQKEETQ